MQYLGAERMGNVLELFPDVCCSEVCIVQRLKWQEFVRMCARKVQRVLTVWIVNCLWGCGVCKLVCWLHWYVAVTVLQLAAMLWTHWAWNLVKIWKYKNSWSCSFGFLCLVFGVCCDVSEECTAYIFRVTMCFMCGMWGALLGLV